MFKSRLLALYTLALCGLALLVPAARASDPTLECPGYHIWGRLDYLYWQVQNSPIPDLVTTGPIFVAAPGVPGQLGLNSTGVLLGDSINYGGIDGVRATAGLWFDVDGMFGMEASIFTLESTTQTRDFMGAVAGGPVLSIPFFDTTSGQTALVINNPETAAGNIFFSEQLRLYGGNADFILTACRTSCMEVNYFIGFRAVYLGENLNMTSFSSPLPPDANAAFTFVRGDIFQTRNFFYGGEVGLRTTRRSDYCFLELGAKIAVGNNFQSVAISGQTVTVPNTFGPSVTTPGGVFAQSSNIGRYTKNTLCVVPEVQARLGLELSSHIKLSLGYDFLFISSVVRPGDQIDTVIGPAPGGVTRPTFDNGAIRTTSFFAHGLSLGMELRF